MRLVLAFLFASALCWATTPFGTIQTAYAQAHTATVNVPGGGTTISANTLVVIWAFDHSGTPGFVTPSGFTQAGSIAAGSIDQGQAFYQSYSSGSTLPASVTVTANDSGTPNIGLICFAYQGYNSSTPMDVTAVTVSQTTPSVTTFAAPSITPTQANDTIVWLWGIPGDVGTSTITVSKGTKQGEVTRSAAGANLYMAMADFTNSTSSASGTSSLTWGTGKSVITAMTLAIKAASASLPAITTTSPLTNGTQTVVYSTTFASSGGVSPYTYSLASGSLPPGLTLASSGVLSGTPTALGTFTFSVGVTDNVGGSSSSAYSLTIYPTYYTPPALDAYGGIVSVPCTNTGTAFSIDTVNKHKVFCTPAGHAFYLRGPYTMDISLITTPDESGSGYNDYALAKYGSGAAWGVASVNLMKTWGWNTIGPYGSVYVMPPNVSVPFMGYANIVGYSMTNSLGYGCPTKDLYYTLGLAGNTSTWGGFRNSNGSVDFRDPCYAAYHAAFLANNSAFTSIAALSSSDKHFLIGIADGDSDNMHGLLAGPDFSAQYGNNDFREGYVSFFVSPVSYADAHLTKVYPDGTIYLKNRMQALLTTKYSTASALNTAWGSSYTTLGTSGYCAGTTIVSPCATSGAAESLGTGDGTTKTFSATASHTTISSFSVYIAVGGTIVGGDTGTGTLYGTGCGGLTGTVNYSTGAISATCTTAPGSGAAVTTGYIANGWGLGTGFMDEDCRSAHASYCGNGSNSTTIYLTGIPSNVQTDINALTKDIATYYSSTGNANVQAWAAANGFTGHVLYMGSSANSSWGVPPDRYVLQGYAGNIDVLTSGDAGPGYSYWSQSMIDFVQTYMGDVPLIESSYRTANAQSAMAWPNSSCTRSGTSVTCTVATPNKFSAMAGSFHIDTQCTASDYEVTNVNFTATSSTVTYTVASTPASGSATCTVSPDDGAGWKTQNARGLDLYNDVTASAGSVHYTASGVSPYVGYLFWGWQDNWAEGLNWGVVSVRDNPYNGIDDVTGTTTCQGGSGATCGGELALHGGNLGDVITLIGQANASIDSSLVALTGPGNRNSIITGSPLISGTPVIQ